MKKKIIISLLIGSTISLVACGNNIDGTYIGEDGGGTLEISDGDFSYYEEHWIGDLEFSGSCSKKDNNTYELESEDVTLYADVEGDGKIFVYSDSSKWRSEYFRKTN